MKEENEIRQAARPNAPALRAVAIHKARLEGEYLLRELCSRGYLPAYGFPTHIAPFDNLTLGRMRQAEHRVGEGREDNRFRRRELASRDLATALREYAPGAEVVMDGLVYRSAGVTLNWHIPADQQEAREIQDIRLAWRCRQCGASGASHSLQGARRCDACGADIAVADIQRFLKPAGFAVDFFKEPSNDITTQHFIPAEPPWIDAGGEWTALPNPDLGRFRVSPKGHVFYQSRGIHGRGYALCLECGRAEPMSPDGSLPEVFNQKHRKLRRAKEEGLFCQGSDNDWKIKPGIILGHDTETDVFELQLKSEAGQWLDDTAEKERTVQHRELADKLAQREQELQALREQMAGREARIVELTTRREAERDHFEEQLALLQDSRRQMTDQFQVLAQKILEEKGRTFNQQSQEGLQGLLGPFREQLKEFRTRVDAIHDRETAERASLKKEIESLRDLNKQISQEAVALTRALKGDKKAQGTWGELVLERVLEKSGLRKGVEYETQGSFRDAAGNLLRLVVESIEKLGNQINTVHGTYKEAINRLARGRGNVMSRLAGFSELGVPIKRPMPQTFMERAEIEGPAVDQTTAGEEDDAPE